MSAPPSGRCGHAEKVTCGPRAWYGDVRRGGDGLELAGACTTRSSDRPEWVEGITRRRRTASQGRISRGFGSRGNRPVFLGGARGSTNMRAPAAMRTRRSCMATGGSEAAQLGVSERSPHPLERAAVRAWTGAKRTGEQRTVTCLGLKIPKLAQFFLSQLKIFVPAQIALKI